MTDGFRLPDRLFEQGYRLSWPTPKLVETLAADPNPKDVLEVSAVSGLSFKRALAISIGASPKPYFVLGPRREPLAAIGVAEFSLLDDTGVPWMLGSSAVPGHARALLSASRAWLTVQQARYSRLENAVDASYEEAIRWLSWLGFDILPAEPTGNNRALIRRIRWAREASDGVS